MRVSRMVRSVLATGGCGRTHAAVDTKSGAQDNVYVGWATRCPNRTGAPSMVKVAASLDGGKTFGDPVHVSSFYKKTVKDAAGKEYPVHNFVGATHWPWAPTAPSTVLGWDDTRNGAEATPLQDIYARSVQFKALGGGGNDTARTLAAVMGGLAIAGVLLLAVALAARRRLGPAPAVVTKERAEVT